MNKLIIVGAGGLGAEALWVALEMNQMKMENPWEIVGLCDDDTNKHGELILGFKVLGKPEDILKKHGKDIYFNCGIGNNQTRQEISTRLENYGWKAATLIHPSVVLAPESVIGAGSYIGAGTIVAPYAKIGRHVLINTCAGIGHHSVLGDFSQICPGARVNGDCRVGKLAFLGTNASLQPGVTIGEGATVASNSYALRSVTPFVTVIGVPAKVITKRPMNK